MWQSDNNAQAVLPLSGLSSTITRVLCNTICNTELLIPLGWPVPAIVTVVMEVLSSPLFALVCNNFPNRERKGTVKGPWTACTSGSDSADGSPIKSSVCLGILDT